MDHKPNRTSTKKTQKKTIYGRQVFVERNLKERSSGAPLLSKIARICFFEISKIPKILEQFLTRRCKGEYIIPATFVPI